MVTRNDPSFLVEENLQFAGTGGISANNVQARFCPAFQDVSTGQVVISRFRDGRPAPFHLIDGLPDDWFTGKDVAGKVSKLKDSVVSGFVRFGLFYTRQQAAEFMERFAS